MKECRTLLLTSPPHRPDPALTALVDTWRLAGAPLPLERWHAALPNRRIARVDGGRHDLWWEFALKQSFRWQAHLFRLPEVSYRRRLLRLAFRFGLIDLLEERVEDLTPAERARADLAVALLPHPDLLIWEEPFAAIPLDERPQVVRAVHALVLAEGLTVVAGSRSTDGLDGIPAVEWERMRALS